jgi:hypothetical protein
MFSSASTSRVVIEQLQDQIRKLQAAPRRYLSVLRTGLAPLDALLPSGGFVLGQAVELWGEAASGRTTLALKAVAAAHRESRLCAYIDGPLEFYPPAAVALGVDLRRLLWVRPTSSRQLVWAALQLLRSGMFAGVVLDLTRTSVRLAFAQGKKLTDAAAQGGSALWVLTPPEAPAEGMTRFHARAELPGLMLEIVRARQGGQGQQSVIPWELLRPGLDEVMRQAPDWEQRMTPMLAREKSKTEDRNGPIGIIGQRPGRDASWPQLRPILGLETGLPEAEG